MRSFCTLIVVAFLSACASTTADQSATTPQNAIYVVGDGTVPMHLRVRTDDGQPTASMQDLVKPMHLNWFFSGR